MPNAQITYPQSAFGYSGAQPAGGGGGTTATFVASAAITQGAAVQLDAAGTVSPQTTATAVAAAMSYLGAAQDGTAAAGEIVTVVTSGPAQVLVAPGTYTGATNLIAGGTGGIYASGACAAGTGNAVVVGTQTVTGSNGLINAMVIHV